MVVLFLLLLLRLNPFFFSVDVVVSADTASPPPSSEVSNGKCGGGIDTPLLNSCGSNGTSRRAEHEEAVLRLFALGFLNSAEGNHGAILFVDHIVLAFVVVTTKGCNAVLIQRRTESTKNDR